MARLTENFNFPDPSNMTMEELFVVLQRMYTDLAIAINQKPDVVQRSTDGVSTETFLAQGTININLTTDKVEMLTNHLSPSAVTWTQLS